MAHTDHTELLLAQHALLTSETSYEEAISLVLKQAQQHLMIFDQALQRGDFASLRVANTLQAFLRGNPAASLTVILQNTLYFEQHCPRLYSLLQTYGHQMSVYETDETVKHIKECFIIADHAHFVRRIHIDHARFRFALNDTEACEPLKLRFNALREATHYPISTTQLGL